LCDREFVTGIPSRFSGNAIEETSKMNQRTINQALNVAIVLVNAVQKDDKPNEG
jgi:hypothetical protein